MRLGVVPIDGGGGGGGYQYSLAFLDALANSRRDDEIVIISWDVHVAGAQQLIEEGARVHVLRRRPWRVALRRSVDALARARRALRLGQRAGTGTPHTTSIGEPGRLVAGRSPLSGWTSSLSLAIPATDWPPGYRSSCPSTTSSIGCSRNFPRSVAGANGRRVRRSSRGLSLPHPDPRSTRRSGGRTSSSTTVTSSARTESPCCRSSPHRTWTQATPEAIATVRQTYALPEHYLFYPAQFWPHKNHRRVIEALAQREKNLDVVMAGSSATSIATAPWRRSRDLPGARRRGSDPRARPG